MPPKRGYPVKRKAVEIGAKHEMEHTKSPRTARRIARDHLREHPLYYEVLPVAEKMMTSREKNIKPIRRQRRIPDGPFYTPPGRIM